MKIVKYSGSKIPKIENITSNMEVCFSGNLPEIPDVVIIKNMLTEDQCDFIIDTAKKFGMKKATLQSADGSGKSVVYENKRKAFYSQPGNDKFNFLSEKIEYMTGWKRDDFEDFSVVNYPTNGFVTPHWDWSSILKRTRVATFVTYLNSPIRGGQTIFPKLKKMYRLSKGDSIFFNYVPNTTVNDLHGSNKVLEGEKWIITSWLQEI